MGRRRAAQGHTVQLPAARRGDGLGRRFSGTGTDRGADVRARNDVQNDRPVHPAGQIGRRGDCLRRTRTRRLYADLTRWLHHDVPEGRPPTLTVKDRGPPDRTDLWQAGYDALEW